MQHATLAPFCVDCTANQIECDKLFAMTSSGKLECEVFRRVLLMLHELHKRGFQRLRAAPFMSASGMYWRCNIAPRNYFLKEHGATVNPWAARRNLDLVARYHSAQGARFFGWTDALEDSPAALANKFLARFGAIAKCGSGLDKPYAVWFTDMLRATEPDGLIYAHGDDYWFDDHLEVINWTPTIQIPLPPPGGSHRGWLGRLKWLWSPLFMCWLGWFVSLAGVDRRL